jgi:uncharacterized protein (TIGR02217 family)
MAFYEIQFPPKISFGAQGGPGFSTDVVVVSSGAEQRNIIWSQARRRYDVAHAARLQPASDEVKAFFHNMRGRAHGFRFKDWTDYQVIAGEGSIVTIGSVKHLGKRYTSGAQTYDRVITKPVSGTVTVTGGGTVDYTTGIITGGTPTSWVGEFDVPVRFDTDELVGEILNRNVSRGFIVGWREIPLVELKL